MTTHAMTAATSQYVTINLYGDLAERFGKSFRLAIGSPREAGRALALQVKGFAQHIGPRLYRVLVGPLDKDDARSEDELDLRLGAQREIHIIPIIAGSGQRGGVLKVILGVALIGAALVGGIGAGFGAAAIGTTGSMFSVSWAQVGFFGLSLMLNGVTSMLSPQPQAQRRADERSSFLFDGPVNVMEQGNVVPLVYGEIMTGGIVVSAALDTEQL